MKTRGFINRKEEINQIIDTRSLKLINYSNERIIRSRFSFDYQPYDEPQIQMLRSEYTLDKIIKTASSEFEKMLLLESWVHSKLIRGAPYINRPRPVSALFTLKNAERGHPDFCTASADVLIQCLLSVGFQARLAGNINSKLINNHAAVEVWSNQYRKWILLDATRDIYYVNKDRIPLNALEIHNLNRIKKWDKAKIVWKDKADNKFRESVDYYSFLVVMGNDFMSYSDPDGKLREKVFLKRSLIEVAVQWCDNKRLWNVETMGRFKTDNADDLYWTLNQVTIHLRKQKLSKKPGFDILLETETPCFDRYLIKIDNEKWKKAPGSGFIWKLHKGLNTLKAKIKNKFGIDGIVSSISFEYL